jgi:drug/metabolite transporter (DMT)-like permease
MIYSLSGVFSKLASGTPFLSAEFFLYYSCIIVLLVFYAIGWQQIIKRLPLTTAFSNKAVTIVWGIIWGRLFFHETITAGKLIGAMIVVSGVVLFSLMDEKETDG